MEEQNSESGWESFKQIIEKRGISQEELDLLKAFGEMIDSGSNDPKLGYRLFSFFSSLGIKLPETERPRKYDSVIPLFYRNSKGEYISFASAVLLEISTDIFLLTAAHVFSDSNLPQSDNPVLFFACSDEILQVIGNLHATGKGNEKDEYDFAYVKLDEGIAQKVKEGATVLKFSDLAWKSNLPANTSIVFTGYPYKKSKAQGNVSTGELFEYVGIYITDKKLYIEALAK